MFEHLVGILAIAIPFLVLAIWVFRHNSRIDENHKRWLDAAAQSLGTTRTSNRYEFDFSPDDIDYKVGIAHGGESDPTMLYVSCFVKPFPDGIIYIFAQGFNRWVSKELNSSDHRFNKNACYQRSYYQKSDPSHDLAQHIVDHADVRQAILDIKSAGYSHLYIPGDWAEGSLSKKISNQFTDANDRLMAYATNPKEKHFAASRIRKIAKSLQVISTHIATMTQQN